MKTFIKVGNKYFIGWADEQKKKVGMNGHSQFTSIQSGSYIPVFGKEQYEVSLQTVPEIIRILLDGMRFGDIKKEEIKIEVSL